MINHLTEHTKRFLTVNHLWLAQIVITLLVTLVVYVAAFLLIRLFGYRHSKVVSRKQGAPEKTKPTLGIWWWGFFSAVTKPLYVAIWVLGVIYCLKVIRFQYPSFRLLNMLDTAQSVLLILVLFWFFMRFIRDTSRHALAIKGNHKPDITTVYALMKVGKMLACVVVGLVFLQEFGVPLSGVVAFGGGSALIVGIAAKDLLANFFGGWVVIMDKPFKVGDWVSSPDKQIEGTVEYIGWRSTRIRTFDKRPLYVPNALFTTIAIENPSRMLNRRIKQIIGVRYDDAKKVADISKAIELMLKEHPDIDQTQTTFVSLVNYGESSLDLLVYTFTKTTAWVEFQKIQQSIMLSILDIIESYGAESAFPTQTLEAPKGIFLPKQDTPNAG